MGQSVNFDRNKKICVTKNFMPDNLNICRNILGASNFDNKKTILNMWYVYSSVISLFWIRFRRLRIVGQSLWHNDGGEPNTFNDVKTCSEQTVLQTLNYIKSIKSKEEILLVLVLYWRSILYWQYIRIRNWLYTGQMKWSDVWINEW